MKKLFVILIICTISIGYFRSGQFVAASPMNEEIVNNSPIFIDPSVTTNLEKLNSSELLTVILTLRHQADLSHIQAFNRSDRLQGIERALQAVANANQRRLTGVLNRYMDQGLVESFTPLWVFNGFSLTATSDVIRNLSQDPDVAAIHPDDVNIAVSWGTPEANINLVNAPQLWSLGYTGQGVTVANLDSGVDTSNPDLMAKWRGGTNSWFDPFGQHATPADLSGHGTSTMGIMVAGDAGGTSIGVAPGAKWIAAKIFDDQGNSSATAIHLSFQWLLDPDNDPNTADAPQVVNNSWTFANPGCYLDFELDLQALRAAGILPVFAAGNGGPFSNTSFSPSNNPSAFAVGAIDNTSQIYAYSSRGPSTCGGSTGPYPELVAPGVNILTTGLAGTYYTDSGTSFAAPHVAGGLALLLSAFPNMDSGMQEQSLIQSAFDLGASGPDDIFGYGRLDLLSALNSAVNIPTSTPVPTPTPSSTPMPTATPTAVSNNNLAINKPVTVSSFQDASHNGMQAIDGIFTTQWQTAQVKGRNKSNSEWIEIDLGTATNVSQVNLFWDSYFAISYSIQISNDGNNWLSVYNTTSGGGRSEVIQFPTIQSRFIRLYSTDWNNNSYRIWLNEFEVYTFSSTATASPTPTTGILATATPTYTMYPTATATPTATSITGNSIHVGDIDASALKNGNRWEANVTIFAHDSFETNMQGVLVNGVWSNGFSGSGSCITGSDGSCSISLTGIKNNVTNLNFTVTNLSFNLPYLSQANHDPDNDSNGSTIVINRP